MQHTHLTTIAVPTHKKSHFTIQRVNYVTFPFSTGRIFAKELFLPHEIRMRSHTVAMFLFSFFVFSCLFITFFFPSGTVNRKGGGGSEVENGHKTLKVHVVLYGCVGGMPRSHSPFLITFYLIVLTRLTVSE